MNPEKVAEIVAEIKKKEAGAHQSMVALAWEYRKLIDECGGVAEASRQATAAGLAYAYASDMRKLVFWAEITDAMGHNGTPTMVGGPECPFTERQLRPILGAHYEDVAGPGGIADVWDTLDEQNIKGLIAAVKNAYPKEEKPATPGAKLMTDVEEKKVGIEPTRSSTLTQTKAKDTKAKEIFDTVLHMIQGSPFKSFGDWFLYVSNMTSEEK